MQVIPHRLPAPSSTFFPKTPAIAHTLFLRFPQRRFAALCKMWIPFRCADRIKSCWYAIKYLFVKKTPLYRFPVQRHSFACSFIWSVAGNSRVFTFLADPAPADNVPKNRGIYRYGRPRPPPATARWRQAVRRVPCSPAPNRCSGRTARQQYCFAA